MALLILRLCLLFLARLSLALEPVGANGPVLINNSTKGLLTLNGMWYALSNSTTDLAKMDSMTNAEACTRDAALMKRLGINTIYVDMLDPTLNHDDCFSIFNSVGIYVAVILEPSIFTDNGAIDNTYTTERLKQSFEKFDAVKDYENLLAIDVGIFPDMYQLQYDRYADAQKIFRAFIRDIKEYISLHSPRPLLVGATLTPFESGGNLTVVSPSNYLACTVPNESSPSNAEFVSFFDFQYYEYDPRVTQEKYINNMATALKIDDMWVPAWYSAVSSAAQNGKPTFEVWNETLAEVGFIYNVSNEVLSPFGPFAGAGRYEWTNVRLNQATSANWGITMMDPDGNIQLTENFDTLRSIFSQYNTESWLSGDNAGVNLDIQPSECKKELIANYTSSINSDTTLTLATDWQLPTRPAGLDALITSGAQGTRGQMVDVVVTTIKYEIKDSKGSVITDLALSPSKSQARSTTGTGTSSTSVPPSTGSAGLSTGAKAGIGVGVSLGAVLALAGAGFLLYRRRRKRRAAVQGNKEGATESDEMKNGNKYEKAELATGPDVEAQAAELPGKMVETPKEVPGDAYPDMNAHIGAEPVELPTTERTIELPESRNLGNAPR